MKQCDVIRFIGMTSLCSTAAPDCHTHQNNIAHVASIPVVVVAVRSKMMQGHCHRYDSTGKTLHLQRESVMVWIVWRSCRSKIHVFIPLTAHKASVYQINENNCVRSRLDWLHLTRLPPIELDTLLTRLLPIELDTLVYSLYYCVAQPCHKVFFFL